MSSPNIPKITVRARRPSDLPALIPILRSVYEKFQYPVEGPMETDSEIAAFISPSDAHQIWVAETSSPPPTTTTTASPTTATASASGQRVIGHVAVSPFMRNAREADWAAAGCRLGNSCHVGRLFVDPQAQGLGAGRALMRTVMEWAVAEGKRLCIYVVTKDVAATALYEKLGWRRIGMETYRGWDNWMYVWHGYEEERKLLET